MIVQTLLVFPVKGVAKTEYKRLRQYKFLSKNKFLLGSEFEAEICIRLKACTFKNVEIIQNTYLLSYRIFGTRSSDNIFVIEFVWQYTNAAMWFKADGP